MAQKRRKPALRTGSELVCLVATGSEITSTLSAVQQRYLKARFGLAADRARLVAALHFGEARQ